MKDQLNVSSASKISMPIANLAMVISLVATVVLMYSSITQRITSLETSRELMLNDLLKASDQKPIDQEQFLIQESLSADLEKLMILLSPPCPGSGGPNSPCLAPEVSKRNFASNSALFIL